MRRAIWFVVVLGMTIVPVNTLTTTGGAAQAAPNTGVAAGTSPAESPPSIVAPAPGNVSGGRSAGVLCEGGGRFLVEGEPVLLEGEKRIRISAVSISGQQVSLGPAFPPVPISLHLSELGTMVSAHWPASSDLPRGAQLRGVIASTCTILDAVLHVPGQGQGTGFQAALALCREGGEECAPEDLAARNFQRWLGVFQPRAFPLGYIPKGALGKAQAELASAQLADDQWVSIGPAPVHLVADDIDIATINSGRVQAIAVEPGTEPETGHWLIGAAQGGIWETDDFGETWEPRADDQPSLIIGAIAFAPGMPNVVYAGTGAYYPSYFTDPAGAGLLKSTDGGTTWGLLAAGTFGGLGFSSIRVSPADPGTIVAATANPAAYDSSNNYTPPSNPKPGVYRSTDGGQNWDRELAGDATDLVAHPNDFSHQYAALGNQQGSAANGVYRSMDGGMAWTAISGPWIAKVGGVGETRLALSPSAPDVLYVSIRDATNGKGKDGHLLGLWKTQNAWAPVPTWVEIPWNGPPNVDYVIGHSNHVITVHPAFPDVLYAGGVSLWKYYDGTWVEYGEEAVDIHADQDALAWDGLRLLVGNDGGVYSRVEPPSILASAWTQHNTNLAIALLHGGAVHPEAPDRPLAGAWDEGVMQRDPFASSWSFFGDKTSYTGGDGQGAFFGSDPQRFGMQFVDTIQRTKDGGMTVEAVANQFLDSPKLTAFLHLAGVMRRCPADENIVLLPMVTLWRTDNFFSALTGQDVAWAEDAQFITFPTMATAVAFAPSDATCGTYAVATNTGGIFLHRPVGGPLFWFDLDLGHQLPGRYVTGLAFSPMSADTLYVTFSGFDEGTPGEPGHVFKTTNATAPMPTWADVSPPVNLPYTSVVVAPPPSATVYVGTDMGLWVSDDGGANWAHAGPASGLPNVPVYDIAVDPCGVTAFTWGRGAFRSAVPYVCP
jgi:photosystem II stability/assembly factor-like uncharacterized protein